MAIILVEGHKVASHFKEPPLPRADTPGSGCGANLFDQFELYNLGPLVNSYVVLILGIILAIVLLRGNKVIPRR